VTTELSLTVPITNSLAFLFTVLGEWWAEGKVIGRGKQPRPAPHDIVLTPGSTARYLDRHGHGLGGHWIVCPI
jgi:hypothetical protein